MKRALLLMLGTGLSVAGYAARDYAPSDLLPDPPRAVKLSLSGPSEGLIGRDYYFVAETDGTQVKWLVNPPVDMTVSEDGRTTRLRAVDARQYVIAVAVSGRGDTQLDGLVFTAVDATPEVVQLSGPSLDEELDRRPPPGIWSVGAKELRRVARELREGIHEPTFDPIDSVQAVLGEEWRDFLDDLRRVALRLERSEAASYAPLLEEAAGILED